MGILNWVIRESLTEKVTFVQRFVRGEVVSHEGFE